jgi:hypothetical protein
MIVHVVTFENVKMRRTDFSELARLRIVSNQRTGRESKGNTVPQTSRSDMQIRHYMSSIEPRHYADLIAVPGDPLKDISELLRVSFIIKGGTVIKN